MTHGSRDLRPWAGSVPSLGIFLSSVLHFPGLPANIGPLLKFSPIIRQEEHIYFEQIQTSDVTR